jgi:predicted alpha/beta superfamily hydrolase
LAYTEWLPYRRAQDEGRLRLHSRFPTKYLSTPRDIVVYLPPGCDASARYPVFYLQDGQNLFDPATAFNGQDWQADIVADALIASGAIEPILMVGVYNTGVRRLSEYTPTRDPRTRKGGKGARYAQMLARELKPFIEREYGAKRAVEDAAVGGSSLGALASLETGLLYPRVFGKLAVMSPSVWWDQRSILKIVRAYKAPARPRVWLDTGTEEGESAQQALADTRLLRDALLEKGWREGVDLSYAEFTGAGHNELAWGGRFGEVLRYFFGKV